MSVDRAEALEALRAALTDELVVAGLGNPSYDLFNAGDRPEHLYLWGGMGLAPSIGLGVALAAPSRRVIAMEGDGGVLMNLGALATIGRLAPANLAVIVWDNGVFDLTGAQATATGDGAADLAGVAAACGIASVRSVASPAEFAEAIPSLLAGEGPVVVVVATGPTPRDRVKPLVPLRRRFLEIEAFTDVASMPAPPSVSTA